MRKWPWHPATSVRERTLQLPWQPQEEGDKNRMLDLLSQWWWLGEFSGYLVIIWEIFLK